MTAAAPPPVRLTDAELLRGFDRAALGPRQFRRIAADPLRRSKPPKRVLLRRRVSRSLKIQRRWPVPVYEYRCLDCDKKFEVVETMAEHGEHEVLCPDCRKSNIERIWSRVVAVTSKKS